ncbi:MAG: DUF1987 domain-containing protein [Chlorobi bacterium]|nr:DUF1987 domain-containing protein [Chlorobiota bacterium]
MEALKIDATDVSPEIIFDPAEKIFTISGISRPEDVRSFYFPVLEWCRSFREDYLEAGKIKFDQQNPLKITIKLKYFNSSSAKFLYDIFMELGEISRKGHHVDITWYYDEGDDDMFEAGEEMSDIAEIPFRFIENK